MSIMTIQEIAHITGKSQKTIRRAIHSKELKATMIQNHYQIDSKAYECWIKGNKTFVEKEVSKERKEVFNWIDISDIWSIDGWKNVKQRNGLNFIDLFAGAGGLSCGMVMAGYNPIATVEIMPQAVATYEHNFVIKKDFDEQVETRDIRSDEVKEKLYESIEGKKVDVIVGGFPCQGFSMAGYRVVTDERNSLYLEMLKIVKKLQPEFIVMENVEGLRSMLGGKVEEKIINDYKEIGYEINLTILNSADYEVPQTRRRLIFIGNRIGATNYHPTPLLTPDKYKTVKDGIQRFMKMGDNPEINHVASKHSPEMLERLAAVPEGKSLYKNYSDAWKKVHWNKPSCTIKENHGGTNIHPKLNRCMTARELAALQSFPDDFIFQGTKKWQLVQIGNAVPPLLGKAIGLAVLKSIKIANGELEATEENNITKTKEN